MDTAVVDAARRFRAAAEPGGFASAGLLAFPKGACGDTAEMLGQYLADSGLGEWTYCSGVHWGPRYDHTHAWLERGGVVVDITADQFPDGPGRVVVTEDQSWHSRYSRMPSHVAGLHHYARADPGVAARATADYRLLKARADAAKG